ncbi:MAG: FAD-dependent oxidoreductase [Anaerolineae bacterium]|nr:FAD-dependent oxidoreductase [Anaerolineae bacterium]
MKMQKIVVIGAGVGGLTTAALLAKAGFEVTVLEAHVYSGGCAGTFYHQGYHFDAGATLAGGFQPGGPHHIVGELLNLTWPVRRAEPAWVVQLPDARIIRWGLDAAWRAERAEKLPQMRHFWRQQEYVADRVWNFSARVPAWPPANLTDWARLFSKVRLPMVPTAPLALASFGQWLEFNHITDRQSRTFIDAQLLISAQVTAAQANALYGAIAMDLPRAGAHHVQGGIGNLAKTLARGLREQGGELLFRQQVTCVVPQPGGGYLVRTNKGLEMRADGVVANLTPWALASLLGEHAPAALRQELDKREEPWGAFTLYAGVDADAVRGDCDHYQVVMDYDKPLGEANSVFISLSDPEDTSRAPAGQRTLTMSTHTHLRSWWELQRRYPEAFAARAKPTARPFCVQRNRCCRTCGRASAL